MQILSEDLHQLLLPLRGKFSLIIDAKRTGLI
jgi:hypothetical protein